MSTAGSFQEGHFAIFGWTGFQQARRMTLGGMGGHNKDIGGSMWLAGDMTATPVLNAQTGEGSLSFVHKGCWVTLAQPLSFPLAYHKEILRILNGMS